MQRLNVGQGSENNTNVMYAILFAVVFFMFILPEMNKRKCNNQENMSGWFSNAAHNVSGAAHTVSGAAHNAVGDVAHSGVVHNPVVGAITNPNRCNQECCKKALFGIPGYAQMNAVCIGRHGCVCMTPDEKKKLGI